MPCAKSSSRMPTDATVDAQFTIEPFDPKLQDRTAFSCGVTQIDNYLKLKAKKGGKADMIRIWVALDDATCILGFYGINMHFVLADEMQKIWPRRPFGMA